MVDNMEKRGCKVDAKDFFVVRHCDEKVGGGFDESASKHGGVVLCQNHIRDYQHTGASEGAPINPLNFPPLLRTACPVPTCAQGWQWLWPQLLT